MKFCVVAELLPIFKSGGRLQGGVDLNSFFNFGIYSFTTGDVINAGAAGASILIVYGYADNRVIQVQISMGGSMHVRFYTGSWSAWT